MIAKELQKLVFICILVAGLNTLELDVTNCWANRLIGDSLLPKDQRKTRSNMAKMFDKPKYQKPLRVSGLLGPVRLQLAEIVGENQKNADIVVAPYPCDHRALVATFTIAGNTKTKEKHANQSDAGNGK